MRVIQPPGRQQERASASEPTAEPQCRVRTSPATPN